MKTKNLEIKNLIEQIEINEKETDNIPILIGMIIGGFLPLLLFFIISNSINNIFLLNFTIIIGLILSLISSITNSILIKNVFNSREKTKK
ncbi:MAG: hypothetical protein ACP5RD_01105 [bacterium]|jgi:VIT1/CCC1 family predicted Fe2+/Mn2+ transporter